MLCGRGVFSQGHHFTFKRLTTKDGLSYPDVKCAIKDREGFMWFGTLSGLNRFDGSHFEVFRKSRTDTASLPGNSITALGEDANGLIWCATSQGVVSYDKKIRQFRRHVSADSTINVALGVVYRICLDSKKNLWFITYEGLLRFDPEKNDYNAWFHNEHDHSSLSSNHLSHASLVEDTLLNGFWLASFKGLNFYSHSENRFYNYRYNPLKLKVFSDRIVEDLVRTPSGTLWYHSVYDSCLIGFDGLRGTLDTVKFIAGKGITSSSYNVVGMISDRKNNLYISTWQGYPLYFDTQSRTFTEIPTVEYDPTSNINSFVSDFYQDEEGNVWFCSMSGVSVYSPVSQRFRVLWPQKKIFPDYHPSYMSIGDMIEDSLERIWFVADGAGLLNYDMRTGEFHSFRYASDDFKANNFFCITKIGDEYWLGSRRGILIFHPGTGKFRKFEGVRNDPEFYQRSVIFIREDNSGNIWFGSWITGLYRYNLQTGICRHYLANAKDPNAIPTGIITSMLCDRDGDVFLGTPVGLSRYQPETDNFVNYLVDINAPHDLRSAVVHNIFQDKRGTIWLASVGGGVAMFDKKTGKRKAFTDEDGLGSNYIGAIDEDLLGNIWFGSQTGLIRYSTRDSIFENIRIDYNYRPEDFSRAILSTSSGMLYAVNYNTLVELDPRITLLNRVPQKTLISGFRVFEHDIPFRDSGLHLSYSQNFFSIRFSSLSQSTDDDVEYACMMEGFDKDWNYTGSRSLVSYTNVPGGDYIFKIKTRFARQTWNPNETVLPIHISKIYYQTWGFRFLVAFFMFAVIRLYVRFRNRQQKRTEAEQAVAYFANSEYTNNSPEEILWDLARNCISRLGFADCVIYLVDEERQVLIQKAALGEKTPDEKTILNPIEIPMGKGIVGSVAATGKTEVVEDTSKDDRYIRDDAMRLSEIAVPILNEGKVIGVIDSEHPKRDFFNKEHKRILETIASICATKIVNAKASQQLLEKEKKLLEVDKRVAEVRLMALRAQMNPHFIFNCLNAIDNYILKNDVEVASRYLNKFARLIRAILSVSDKNFITLSTELELLKNYIELENLRFEEKFSFSLNVAPEIQPDDIDIPSLLIQPFVENAIVHGLNHKKGEKKLSIDILLNHENLVCFIEDNGIGREAAQQIKNSRTQTHESKGMKVTEGRLELLQQQVKEKSVVKIYDLADASGAPAGTRVEILIPLEQD